MPSLVLGTKKDIFRPKSTSLIGDSFGVILAGSLYTPLPTTCEL